MLTPAAKLGVLAAVLGLTVGAVALRPAAVAGPEAGETLEGLEVAVGNGTARVFVELGRRGEPRVLGIALTEPALTGLATRMNTTSRCFDKNGDGKVTHGECLGDYQADLALPAGVADLGLPVRWATVNWNPEGHLPPAPPVWSAPHFRLSFFHGGAGADPRDPDRPLRRVHSLRRLGPGRHAAP